jgi:uncharacterized repeat protein (TIGR03803 family)
MAQVVMGLSLVWLTAIAGARAQLTVRLLHESAGESEWAPRGLLVASDGKLYGACAGDGAKASVYSLSVCDSFTPLMTFENGRRLQHGLSEGSPGTFYGVLYGAETAGVGTRGSLFSLTTTGRYQVRHAFGGDDGSNPSGPPAVDSAFAVYGVTAYGGPGRDGRTGFGTVYRRDAAGTLTTIFDFSRTDGAQTGIHPASRLVRTTDGTIYGTTSLGGPRGGGTIFRLRPEGATYTFALVAALGGSDFAPGATPHDLLLARDGNLYGRAFGGQGVIFRVTPQGELSVLHALQGADGDLGSAPALPLPLPSGSLLEGADGALYGVAYGGGESSQGTFYSLTLDGSYTVLHAFSGQREGGHPTSVAEASDGRFFGGVESGGSRGHGGIYELAPASFDRTSLVCTTSVFMPATDASPPTRRSLDGGDGAVMPTPRSDTSNSLDAGSAQGSAASAAPDSSSASAGPTTVATTAAASEDKTGGEGGCSLTPTKDSAELPAHAVCALLATLALARRKRTRAG